MSVSRIVPCPRPLHNELAHKQRMSQLETVYNRTTKLQACFDRNGASRFCVASSSLGGQHDFSRLERRDLSVVPLALALFFALSPAAFAQRQKSAETTCNRERNKRGQTPPNAAIKQVLDVYTEAWNRYDSHTMAMLFTEDCDYVVVGGGNTHGREALEIAFAKNFNSNLKNSTRTDSIRRLRFLTPDIASLDDYWVLNVPGDAQPRREGYYNWILVRQGGRWLVAIHHAAQFPALQPAPGK